MHRITRLVCGLLAGALAAGCGENGLDDYAWTAALTVHVIDANTHEPVSGALVTFANDTVPLTPPKSTGTAGRATYEIEIAEGHAVRLDVQRVTHAGWLTWSASASQRAGATLDEEHAAEEVEIELIALAGN